MAGIARVICPGVPHHMTQRADRRQQTFFNGEDYLACIELMAHWCRKHEVALWAWCLMPNHIHLIADPQDEDGLARGYRGGASSLHQGNLQGEIMNMVEKNTEGEDI